MNNISIFDVIGPNMVGPSSSHTAGALRIALLAGKMATGKIVKASFTLYGSFATTYKGHGTDRALVAGILGMCTEDLRIKESFDIADRENLQYEFIPDTTTQPSHPNTVDIQLTCQNGNETLVTGVSLGGGRVAIKKINGIDIDFSGEYNTIIIRQKDTPGIVAYISNCLAANDINIAFMRLYRENKGEIAYTIIEADQEIDYGIIAKISASENIIDATLIHSE